MKSPFFSIIFSILSLASCEKSKYNAFPESKSDANVFLTDSVKVTDSISANKTVSLAYHAQVLVFPAIKNRTLLDSIYTVSDISLREYTAENLRKELNRQKDKFYTQTKTSLEDWSPEFKQTWEQHSYMKLFSTLHHFMIVQYTSDGYTGGAHGYYNEIYKIFDRKKNSTIHLHDVIKNQDKEIWGKILMDHFLKDDVGKGQSEMLLVNRIPLNTNFYFDPNNLYFLYNQYEITAYAAGPVLIKVPFTDIKPFLTTEFKTELGL
jgi:hypothetical protein